MPNHQRISPQTIIHILLWCGVLLTAYYFFHRMIFQETFGFHDWYLFVGHAKNFVLTGTLYDRDLSLYGPSTAIYKFPPLYASLLVLLYNCGFSEEAIHHIVLVTYPCCYFASIIICLKIFQHAKQPLLAPLALMIAFTFEPFFDNYISAQMEVYLLLLLSLSLLYLLRGRELLSGFFIGVAAAIKIYPIYFAGYYLAHQKYSAIAGIIFGLLVVSIFSLALTGWTEHVFYFSHILPTLLTEHISNKGENISIARLLLFFGFPMKAAENLSLLVLLTPVVITGSLAMSRHRATNAATDGLWFAIFICSLLLATKNSWWNYQLLLMIPLLLIAATSVEHAKTACLSIAVTSVAYLMIFWCNLGKLEVLILFFTKVLDSSDFLTMIMLKINLLRGLGTLLILLTLVFLLYDRQRKNISLVESSSST